MSLSSLTSGISGLRASQTSLNVIGNNLANLNTSGFKTSRVSFTDELSQTLKAAQAPTGSVGGTNPIQIGIGTAVGSIDTNYSQGSIAPTGRPFDLAIQGNGFFIVTNGSQDFFTRVGAFNLDKNNDLVDSGTGFKVKNVLGTTLNVPVNSIVPAKATSSVTLAGNLNSNFTSGAINQILQSASAFTTASGATPAVIGDNLNALDQNTVNYVAGDIIKVVGEESDGTTVSVNFTYGGGAGQDGTTLGDLQNFITASFGTATASIDASGNLVLTSDVPGSSNLLMSLANESSSTGSMTIPTINLNTLGAGDAYVSTIPVFDTQGTSYPITLTFEKTGSNTWDITPTMKASDGSVVDGISAVNFNSNGSFSSVTGTSNLVISFSNGSTQTVTLDLGVPNSFTGLSQFSSNSSVATTNQDGFAAGFFLSSTVNQDGSIDALFTNGQSKTVGQLQLATFSNANGLSKSGSNLLTQTASSGSAVLSTALSGKFGSIVNNALESSNVDIAEEFTNLIVAQRSFQANARTITTTDEILQELVNLVR